jgi:hypothetical protein
MTRDQYNWWGGFVAIVVAAISLLCAAFTGHMSKTTAETIGKVVVVIWAIGPPAFFWGDWVYFCGGLDDAAKEIAKHTHDLARNIWLGLLGVLTLAFFKSGGLG